MNSYVEALLMEIYFQRCVETGMKPEKVKLFPICLVTGLFVVEKIEALL